MTGFARARRALGDGELVVSLKSLNHRGLDIHVHAPAAIDPLEGVLRAAVKSRMNRGHVDVRVSLPKGASDSASVLNRSLLEDYVKAFRAAAGEHGIKAEPDLNAAFRLPGMFGEGQDGEAPPGTGDALVAALEEAISELNAFREREGAEIAAEMYKHNLQVAAAASEMEAIRAGAAGGKMASL